MVIVVTMVIMATNVIVVTVVIVFTLVTKVIIVTSHSQALAGLWKLTKSGPISGPI